MLPKISVDFYLLIIRVGLYSAVIQVSFMEGQLCMQTNHYMILVGTKTNPLREAWDIVEHNGIKQKSDPKIYEFLLALI